MLRLNVFRRNLLVAELFIERHVRITVNGGHNRRLLPAEPNFLIAATRVCQSENPKGV